jgi:hypothetical protein
VKSALLENAALQKSCGEAHFRNRFSNAGIAWPDGARRKSAAHLFHLPALALLVAPLPQAYHRASARQ